MTVRVSTACTACGACLVTCPTSALYPGVGRPGVRDEACTDCLACIEVCPAGAVSTAPASNPIELCTASSTLEPIVGISNDPFQGSRSGTELPGVGAQ